MEISIADPAEHVRVTLARAFAATVEGRPTSSLARVDTESAGRWDSSPTSRRSFALDVSSGAVVSLNRIRNRVPLVVFILLLTLLVVALGVICMCATDHPAQVLERALSVIPAAPPLSAIWAAIATVLLAASVVRVRPRLEPERASPAGLQRFLF